MELRRPESVADAVAALGNGSVALAGGTELVPLLRDRIVEANTLVELRNAVPRGIDGTTIGAGTTLGELEVDPEIPAALREACRLSASPQLRAMGTIGTSSVRPRIPPTRRRHCSRWARRCARTGASCPWPISTACRRRTTAR